MYVCGVTVYDLCHIGHARALVSFDVIVRYLRTSGYDVTLRPELHRRRRQDHRAPSEGGVDRTAVVDEIHRRRSARTSTALGCCARRRAEATEHIPEIIDMIERLIERGHAYDGRRRRLLRGEGLPGLRQALRANARRAAWPGRASTSTSGRTIRSTSRSGRRRSRASRRWESPWGPGRPGWHIECSAMCDEATWARRSTSTAAATTSIFPHHENEIAQSEAATGKPFARYWLHNGMLQHRRREDEQVARQLRHPAGRARAGQAGGAPLLPALERTTAARSTSPTRASTRRRGPRPALPRQGEGGKLPRGGRGAALRGRRGEAPPLLGRRRGSSRAWTTTSTPPARWAASSTRCAR